MTFKGHEIRSLLPYTFSDRNSKKSWESRMAVRHLHGFGVPARWSCVFQYLNPSECTSLPKWVVTWIPCFSLRWVESAMQPFKVDGKSAANPSVLRSKTQGHITQRAGIYGRGLRCTRQKTTSRGTLPSLLTIEATTTYRHLNWKKTKPNKNQPKNQ